MSRDPRFLAAASCGADSGSGELRWRFGWRWTRRWKSATAGFQSLTLCIITSTPATRWRRCLFCRHNAGQRIQRSSRDHLWQLAGRCDGKGAASSRAVTGLKTTTARPKAVPFQSCLGFQVLLHPWFKNIFCADRCAPVNNRSPERNAQNIMLTESANGPYTS